MAKIGIFWVYKNQVLGKASDLSQGDESIPGLCDSPDNHIDLWENDQNWQNPFQELIGTEYQCIPRGRVIYSKTNHKAIVYMDKQLHSKQIKQLIRDFFQLNSTAVTWAIDEHYTTDLQEINDIFDDDLY